MVSVDEWAKGHGITRQAAYKRIQQHNIPLKNGKLNQAVADRIWAEFSNAAKQRGGVAGGEAAKAQAALFGEDGQANVPPAEQANPDERGDAMGEQAPAGLGRQPSLSEIQRAREVIAYQRAKYEFEKLKGELIPADQPVQFITELVAQLKSELSVIGAELMDVLAQTSDSASCRVIVEVRIDKVLNNMAKWEPQ